MSKYQVEQITKEAEFRMRADKSLTMEQAIKQAREFILRAYMEVE